MKKGILIIITSLTFVVSRAQTTAIPDANFEQALIDLGYDTGTPDGVVLTSNIDAVSFLDVAGLSITDLTGIEGFVALTNLLCQGNQLTALSVSQNTALTKLDCGNNQFIQTLDVSQNIALEILDCDYNQLTTMDVTQNILLKEFDCEHNQIISLDVSQNVDLEYLDCGANLLTFLDVSQNIAIEILSCFNNLFTSLCLIQNTSLEILICPENSQLTSINLKSGNNMDIVWILAEQNPLLTCIEVDDVPYSTANWTPANFFSFEPQTSFSSNCNVPCSITTDIIENSFSELSIFPNPTIGKVNINLGEEKQDISLILTNSLGQVVLTDNYTSTSYISIDINAPNGIYFLYLESNGEVVTKKIVKE
jgi:hypothetical protein